MRDDSSARRVPPHRPDDGRVGLIAGAGRFPIAAAASLRSDGSPVVAIGFNGLTSPDLAGVVDEMHWLDLGQIVALASRLRESQAQRVLLLGKFSKSLIFAEDAVICFDAEAKRWLAAHSDRSDDGLMTIVAEWLESQDFEILEQAGVLASMLVPCEVLTSKAPTDQARDDLLEGWPVLESLGRAGVGQCVVMKRGNVLATETAEGTDEMIRRAGMLDSAGATVIKAMRSTQDRRMDLPAVGPDTIRAMIEVGASALALEAQATLMLDADTCIAEADRAGIAIWGFDSGRIEQ